MAVCTAAPSSMGTMIAVRQCRSRASSQEGDSEPIEPTSASRAVT
jgi:hypothetical protein